MKDLNVAPEVQGQQFKQETFPIYQETETKYRLPRHYGVNLFGQASKTKLNNGLQIDLSFEGSLKEDTNQHIAVNKALDALHTKGGGVLSLPTGYGKTTVALNIISRMKVKTMIVVHKEFLLVQWVERIKQFLPDAKIGKIQQNKVDIQGKDIVICMLQSLAMKSYPDGTFDTFGFMVIDETHHISSRIFSRMLLKICTKYTLGLSATPTRKDGLSKVMYWFLGDLFYSVERKTKTVNVRLVKFNCQEYEEEPAKRNGKICVPEMISAIVEIEERNVRILDIIKKLSAENRNIIVLSDRRGHCEHLMTKTLENGIDAGLYMGGMKQTELKKSEECSVIFATFSLAQEGLDIAKLDTCILATPKSDVVQACGRVMRETVGKCHEPLIIDFVDMYSCFISQARKRKNWYNKSDFNILNEKQQNTVQKQVSGYQFVED